MLNGSNEFGISCSCSDNRSQKLGIQAKRDGIVGYVRSERGVDFRIDDSVNNSRSYAAAQSSNREDYGCACSDQRCGSLQEQVFPSVISSYMRLG